ncbi:hypothetical protein OIU79_009096 [Salix purpurea]|uniref:Uncharacterized protein n=1 Tax=Salix purpurea TaxID=77065 RepID=A0A9Q0TJV1_SALPP|nr:hypothetical protein OIU79_009096 [Salix purpurea]
MFELTYQSAWCSGQDCHLQILDFSAGAEEHASPMISRAQKKLSENVQVAEKKVSELITSSARKQKCTFPKKNQEPIAATNLNTSYNSVHHKASNASQCDVVDPKGCNEGAAQCVVQAIFSPAFHTSKIAGGESFRWN